MKDVIIIGRNHGGWQQVAKHELKHRPNGTAAEYFRWVAALLLADTEYDLLRDQMGNPT